ncbi:ryanodine receptor 2-like [Oreochromis niloticus]|uniref:ryanodine receptor 2-like n=1 Tax=Oreochromis niloticus TaxID=8128 RepID=UPI000DF3F9DE|nr:ryanodine receptor 2-like isoform X1 [Oreochromis niloticus]XP_025760875.1 ryanodine receptor 2-like [Oreochromis niloticus]CAI5637609.1 unnamed protein product [Mustela putorius furo]
MVLQTISASKGEMGPMVASTLKLGIAILNGGNSTVQQKMLDYLKDKKDVGFFQSLAGLMPSCNVLDLNAFERQNKAEGLGMVTEEGSGKIPCVYTFWTNFEKIHLQKPNIIKHFFFRDGVDDLNFLFIESIENVNIKILNLSRSS